MAWAFLLLVLGLCLAGLAQEPLSAPEPIPALQDDKAPFRVPWDTVVEKVETGKDEFLSERYDEEIKARLTELKEALSHRPVQDTKQLQQLLASEFRGTPLAPVQREQARRTSPTVEIHQPSPVLSVTAQTLAIELSRWLAPLSEIQHIELKTTALSIETAEPPQVRLQIHYDVTGRTTSGEIRQLTGTWLTRWRKDGSQGWLWVGNRVEEASESRAPQPHFTDVTACALGKNPAYEQLLIGVDWWSAHLDRATGISIAGLNGVAVADVDGDGLEDFYLCQPSGLPNRLFRALPDGTYAEISREAGLDALDRASGAVFFDYDNDGDPDLLVTGQHLLLFQNDGRGSFSFQDPGKIGLSPAMDEAAGFYSACIVDYDRDGWLDIYVCSYSWKAGEGRFPDPVPYHDATNGPPNFLFRNNGDHTFTDVTREAGLDHNNHHFSFACAWADYDRDGWPDLYVANDYGRNNLYRANGDGTFADVAARAGVEDVGAGMSATWEDYDNDGWLDLYVGNMWSSAGLRLTSQSTFRPGSEESVRNLFRRHAKGSSLFRNRGDGTFVDATQDAGVARGRWAWASQFVDFDLDGHEDLYVANGWITNESTHDL